MAINAIAEYLKKITGLDSCSVGISLVEQAVSKRMHACNVDTHADYYNILAASKNELSLLIDRVMVPETWFFRGAETFKYLKMYLTEKVSSDFNKVRILTVPCATGEEPYSIAIVLNECGYKPDQYVIDAFDIAHESIMLAKKAVFTEHSFRDENEEIKHRYFDKIEEGFKLAASITDKVAFSYGNIFELNVADENRYDIIFCRNLLIYFDKEAQRKALKKLAELIVDDGVLFIGHGEAGCMLDSPFTRIDAPNAFAFGKSKAGKKKQCQKYNKKEISPEKSAYARKMCGADNERSVAGIGIVKSENNYIEKAIKLANEGEFDKAIDECRKSISSMGASADALCLLGVIHDAIGERKDAITYYERALNLMPTHYQTLMHLASHAERNGEKLKAAKYRLEAMQSTKTSL